MVPQSITWSRISGLRDGVSSDVGVSLYRFISESKAALSKDITKGEAEYFNDIMDKFIAILNKYKTEAEKLKIK
jgi:hypothetical protein